MRKVILYYRGPAYTEAQWSARNPLLQAGEVGYVKHATTGLVHKAKVGPGRWNDLPYFPDVVWDAGTVTAPIGDATGNLDDQTVMQILEKMLKPYVVPQIVNLTNNAQGGSPQSIATREIGAALSGVVRLQYEVINPQNLTATPINVSSGGIFSNDGNFANTGSIDMNLAAPLSPNVVTVYDINVKPLHAQGEGLTVKTQIKYVPRAIWGVSPLTTLTASQLNAIGQKQTVLMDNFRRDYEFTAAGYPWLAIPTMLNPTGLVFTDVTNLNNPEGFEFEDMGALSVNNGVGTYNYQLFRGTYYLTESFSRLRVS